jgi:hypothetical protein
VPTLRLDETASSPRTPPSSNTSPTRRPAPASCRPPARASATACSSG